MARLVMVHVSEVSEATCLAFRMLGALPLVGMPGFLAGCGCDTVDGRNPANHLGWLKPYNGIIIILGSTKYCLVV